MIFIKALKQTLPTSVYERLRDDFHSNKLVNISRMIKNYYYNYSLYSKFSSTYNPLRSKLSHEANIIYLYHKIEKGMSLRKVKTGFGKLNVYKLIQILEDYLIKYEINDICQSALNSIEAYYLFNKRNGYEDADLLLNINSLKSNFNFEIFENIHNGGIKEVNKSDIEKSLFNFKDFAYSRYSIRNFTNENVSKELINEAINIAQKTPSVCNRQTSRIYVYDKNDIKSEILKYQNGNTGFGESANKIIIVTSSLECFMGPNERNQAYIDGGMYSMSLIYALHSLGVGTCPLNLALESSIDKKLKRIANIPDSEVMIMMIAVGNIPEELNVALSYRRDAGQVTKFY